MLNSHIELVASLLESEMGNPSSQKVPLDSPGLDGCRPRNIAQVDLSLVQSFSHYSTLLPKRSFLMLTPLTESQQLRKVLRYPPCAELKGHQGSGAAWWGGQLLKLALCSTLTIFLKKWETKTYETQKCSACVNSYIRENKNLLQHLQRAGLIINTKFLSFLQNYFSY